MPKTINQARADFKKYFKKDADGNLSVEEIASAIASAKLKAAADKSEVDVKKASEEDLNKATTATAKKPKYKARFGKVEIPKMGVFTAEELEANPEACEYLIEIGSPAVVKL